MESIRAGNTEYIELIVSDAEKEAYVLSNNLNISNFKVLDSKTIRVYDATMSQNQITKTLINSDISIEGITKKNGSLEEYFLNLLNGGSINV
ncbi:hypothetical protein SDC9_156977 [bioreactor metagenome]|uniref:DUF4162 domain-containing protein n=1 Tax=bioreactor metagenome TaxID=1076179 RepID=A0A645F5R6_9ZZZZ